MGWQLGRLQLLHETLAVIIKIAIKAMNLAMFTHPDLLAYRGDEMSVVRHHQHSPAVVVQRVNQCVYRIHVQMISGLKRERQRDREWLDRFISDDLY